MVVGMPGMYPTWIQSPELQSPPKHLRVVLEVPKHQRAAIDNPSVAGTEQGHILRSLH